MAQIVHDDSRRPLQSGKTLFDYADEFQLRVPTSCGRVGTCHECVVEVLAGHDQLRPQTDAEKFLGEGFRLACQATIGSADGDVEFALLQSRPKILTATAEKQIGLDPAVSRVGDRVCRGERVVDAYRGRIYGVVVDVGTTTVVAELIDLETGACLYVASFENPQRVGGSDVMHRISYDAGRYRGELHKAIISALNHELREMCRRLDFSRHAIYEVVVVGNSTMRDLFFDLEVQSIGQRPYKSVIELEFLAGTRANTRLESEARTLGLWAHPRATVYGAPLVASHVGADTVAALIAIDALAGEESFMLVDIGTNTEVVARHEGRIVAASCPAGPAFEGGGVHYGMTAVDGAIEAVRLTEGGVDFDVIGGSPPRGLCGSGLIDVLAELRRLDRMTPKGVLQRRAKTVDIVPKHDISLSRADLSNLAQAKAANACGQRIVLRELGLAPGAIDTVYLAGGFAEHIDVSNATAIGFLAPVPGERVVKVGNAALQGARELLMVQDVRDSVDEWLGAIEHVELETTADFFELFVDGCLFSPMPDGLE